MRTCSGERVRWRLLPAALVVFFGVAVAPNEVQAQACFQHAQSGCEAVWIFQFALGRYLRDLRERGAGRSLAMIDVGYLFALDSLNAVGGTLVAGMNDVDGWIGAQGQYRRWLGSRTSVDVGLGLAAPGSNIKAPLVTAMAGLNFTETWSLFVQFQPIDAREWGTEQFTGTKLVPSVTVRVGSRVGLILAGTVSALLAGFAAWASL